MSLIALCIDRQLMNGDGDMIESISLYVIILYYTDKHLAVTVGTLPPSGQLTQER